MTAILAELPTESELVDDGDGGLTVYPARGNLWVATVEGDSTIYVNDSRRTVFTSTDPVEVAAFVNDAIA